MEAVEGLVPSQHEVGWLQVAVDDGLRRPVVQVRKAARAVQRELHGPPDGECARARLLALRGRVEALEHVEQRAACHVLGDDHERLLLGHGAQELNLQGLQEQGGEGCCAVSNVCWPQAHKRQALLHVCGKVTSPLAILTVKEQQ